MSESTINEIKEKKRRTTKGYEKEFQILIINKIKEDLRKHNKRESALILLIETFDDFIHDHKFISWLSFKLDYYPGRLKSLINNTKKLFVPRNSFPNVVLNEIYSFLIKTSIPSTRLDCDATICLIGKKSREKMTSSFASDEFSRRLFFLPTIFFTND